MARPIVASLAELRCFAYWVLHFSAFSLHRWWATRTDRMCYEEMDINKSIGKNWAVQYICQA